MPAPKFTPLHEFLRYYGAQLDGVAKPLAVEEAESAKRAALASLPATMLQELIATGSSAIANSTEEEIREMFKDGHFYFGWKVEGSARRYLSDIISKARST